MFIGKTNLRVFPVLSRVVIMLTLLIGSSLNVTPVYAAGITVNTTTDELNSDGDCSLREAIKAANTNAAVDACASGFGADIITLPAGKYLLTIAGDGEDKNAKGDLDITENLIINGAGPKASIIQAHPNLSDRIFHVAGEHVVSISSVTIANGKVGSNEVGAGLYNDHGTVFIYNSRFLGNGDSDTSFGGGIGNIRGILNVTNSTFSNNTANRGGGIFGGFGTITVANSTFSNNSVSSFGGGVYSAGTLTVTNSTFSGNTATFYGGGINQDSPAFSVTNSTFSGNSAQDGGGIMLNGAGVISNSTFSGNSASNNGGGIFLNFDTMTVNNSIFANSTSGADCWNNSSTVSGVNNLIETEGGGVNACGTTAPLTSDPNLGALTGSPAYFPLNIGSPAIDAGDDTICAAAPVNNTSQNGLTRPHGTHCDIGSFESPLTLRSVGVNDGFVLESTEDSSVGGTLDSSDVIFNLGDDAANKQYRAILHFNTSSLPDTAVITKVTLKIQKQGQVGTNPFNVLGGLLVDMRKPSFGAVALAIGDFQAVAGRTSVATFGVTPVSNWYSAVLNGPGRNYVNKTGNTQFRLQFATDDNDDLGADHMLFHSGNAPAVSRPQLIIEYYIP